MKSEDYFLKKLDEAFDGRCSVALAKNEAAKIIKESCDDKAEITKLYINLAHSAFGIECDPDYENGAARKVKSLYEDYYDYRYKESIARKKILIWKLVSIALAVTAILLAVFK